jgi:DeoR/GlpR family transcriptional regulator of sugar metabolism
MSDPLFLEERRRAIIKRLEQEGRVTVKDLSDEMQVSEVTIRQDLRALEEKGLIERTYGGAVYKGGSPISLLELSFNVRLAKMKAEKRAMAAAASALIQDGFSIALDSSTSASAIIPHLKQLTKLTVVTNSLMSAQSFLGHDERKIKVLIAGGRLRNDSNSTVGQPEELPDINLNVGLFSCHGITSDIGTTEVDSDEVLMKRALLSRCLHHVYLIDSSKWGRVAPYTITSSNELQHVITTVDAPADQVQQLRDLGVQVDVVSVT